MIEFKNATSKSQFQYAIDKGMIDVILSDDNDLFTIILHTYHKYDIRKNNNRYILSFKGYEGCFDVTFDMNEDNVKIISAIHDGKNIKSDRLLKKYSRLGTVLNSVILYS